MKRPVLRGPLPLVFTHGFSATEFVMLPRWEKTHQTTGADVGITGGGKGTSS